MHGLGKQHGISHKCFTFLKTFATVTCKRPGTRHSVTFVKETLCVCLTVRAHFKALQILPSSSFLAREYARPVSEGQTEVQEPISVHWANDSLIPFLGIFHLMSRVSLRSLGWP